MTEGNRTCYKGNVSIRVFIFEDHWMCREALVSVLSKEKGIEIAGATEGVQEGIEEAIKIKPDVVLMDIRFHTENLGIGATSTLKEKLPKTKVIIFTEFPDEEILRGAIKAGASGFLLKKEVQDPDIIVKAIQTVYRGDAYITPSITAKILNEIKRLTEKCKFELTKRELQILRYMTEGKDNNGIAKALDIDIRTVANHVSNILFKMNAKNRTEAAAIARKEGLID
jgi:DNA-binding NarL/FixJ family response regulator